MDLKGRINNDLKQAMRDKNAQRLEVIRMLRAAIQRREVDDRITLDDGQVTTVIEKLVKQARESIAQFEKGGRQDLIEHETAQLKVLEEYLPEQLDESEITSMVEAAITASNAASVKDMGKVMAILKPQLAGRADMGKVSALIRSRLGA